VGGAPISDTKADDITLYFLVQINTEEGELSYTDEVIFDCEVKLNSDYLD